MEMENEEEMEELSFIRVQSASHSGTDLVALAFWVRGRRGRVMARQRECQRDRRGVLPAPPTGPVGSSCSSSSSSTTSSHSVPPQPAPNAGRHRPAGVVASSVVRPPLVPEVSLRHTRGWIPSTPTFGARVASRPLFHSSAHVGWEATCREPTHNVRGQRLCRKTLHLTANGGYDRTEPIFEALVRLRHRI